MCACGHSADAGAVVVRGSLRPLRLGSGPFGSGPLARDGWQPSPALGHTPRLPREPRVSTRRALVLDHQHLVRPPLGEELGEKVSGSLDNAVSSRRPWVVAQRSHRRARAPVQPEESRCLRDQLRQRGCRLQGTISRMSAIVESLRYDDNKWALRLVGRDRCRCHARWAAGVSHGERTGGRHMGHGGHHGIRAAARSRPAAHGVSFGRRAKTNCRPGVTWPAVRTTHPHPSRSRQGMRLLWSRLRGHGSLAGRHAAAVRRGSD